MDSFTPDYSYESFNTAITDQLRNSESAKKLRTLIAKKIKNEKKLPIEIVATEFFEENKDNYEEIIDYITEELNKIGWSVDIDDTTIIIDKLDDKNKEDGCILV